jgi:predicted RNA-binding protein (virulence factor B family)
MAEIGQYDVLPINRLATPGAYIDAGELGEILLPGRYLTPEMVPGRSVEVFVYLDSEDRLVAITERPKAVAGEFAVMNVISVNRRIGAFLDWGIPKDLLLPHREQVRPVSEGDKVVVYVYLDNKSRRLVATTRLKRFLDKKRSTFIEGQSVSLMIYSRTPLGYGAIIEGAFSGLLYSDDVTGRLSVGNTLPGFIRSIRSDGKIDLTLHKTRGSKITSIKRKILVALEENQGWLPLSDKSDPDEIQRVIGASKKVFKRTIGTLYKERRVRFERNGIRLVVK